MPPCSDLIVQFQSFSICVFTHCFRTLQVDSQGVHSEQDRPVQALFNRCEGTETDVERVSTGTKFALGEWVKATGQGHRC